MKSVFFVSFIGLLGLPGIVQAQDSKQENRFSMSAQIRPRAEYRNGNLTPRYEGEKPATFINNRARLSMEYGRKDLVLRISAQHVGVWGQDPQIDKNGRFVMNEAWARLNFGKGFFTQLGRQTLSYDDERILGGLDWNVAGRYHDALKLGYESKAHRLHLILAFNQNDEKVLGGTYYKAGGQPYKNMQAAWYHYQAEQNRFGASLLFLNLGWETGNAETEVARTRYMQTMGTYLTANPEHWNLNAAFYYQTGKNKSDREVSAYMASLRIAYFPDKTWNLLLGSDYLSGNKKDDGKFRAFDPLYGTHHKFYGAMDYFYASAFQGKYAPGLWDNYLGITYKACSKVSMQLNYHYFTTAVKLPDLHKDLGSEVDYQLDCSLMKDVKLSVGYSFMAGSRTMDAVKGGDHKSWQDWGWISLNINPQLLFVKW